jgi:hypothetical protein
MHKLTVPAKQIKWLTSLAFTSKKREVNIEVTDKVYFYNTFWDGGSKNTYKAIKLGSGQTASLNTGSAPWTAVAEGTYVKLEPGTVIVEESIFCGKYMKLRVFVHPDNITPLLTA